MKIRISGKYKLKNSINKSEFDSSLANCLKLNLENERAIVNVENESLKYRIPFMTSPSSTGINIILRLTRFGKGRIWWKTESKYIKYNYLINLNPILISSFLIIFPWAIYSYYSKSNPSFSLIGNLIFLFVLFCLIGIGISKIRASSLIRDCISEILTGK